MSPWVEKPTPLGAGEVTHVRMTSAFGYAMPGGWLSKQIYKDKHNASTQHYGNNKVDKRRENQRERIAQGVTPPPEAREACR